MAIPKYYTPEQVAEALQVSLKIVYQHLRSGQLSGIKLGRVWRIGEDDLNKFLSDRGNNRRENPATAEAATAPGIKERRDPNYLPPLEELVRPRTPEELARLQEISKRIDERREAMAARLKAQGIAPTDSAIILRQIRRRWTQDLIRECGGTTAESDLR